MHGTITSARTHQPLAGAALSAWSRNARQSITADDGTYRFEWTDASITIMVRAEGHAAIRQSYHLETDDVQRDFELLPGGTISGTVTDESGNPIPGAAVGGECVSAVTSPRSRSGQPAVSCDHTFTDEDGSFELVGVPPDASFRIPARAPGYVSGESAPVSAGDQGVVIVLQDGDARLHGVVAWEDGSPATGTSVRLEQRGTPGSNMSRSMVTGGESIKVDEKGAFQFEGLVPGEVTLVGQWRGKQPTEGRSVTMAVELEAGVDKEVRLVFQPRSQVRGRVEDADTGAGIAGAWVRATPYAGSNWSPYDPPDRTVGLETQVTTNAAGEFVVAYDAGDWPEWTVSLRLPVPYVAVGPMSLTLHGPAERPVVFKARKGCTIEGTVVHADGSPASGALVTFRRNAASLEDFQQAPSDARTDAKGEFLVASLPGTQPGRLQATLGQDSAAEDDVRCEAGGSGHRLVLQSPGVISGHVYDESGDPVEGASLVLMHEGGQSRLGLGQQETASTGAYRFENCPTGKVSVECFPPGLDPWRSATPATNQWGVPAPITVDVVGGAELSNVDFHLRRGQLLEGVVTDLEGEPIEGAYVSAHPPSATSRDLAGASAMTDAEGYFSIGQVPEDGRLAWVSVNHEGYEGRQLTNVTVTADPLVIQLTPIKGVRVRVVDGSTGAPVPDFSYRLFGSVLGRWQPINSMSGPPVVSSANGEVVLKNVTADRGTLRIEVSELAGPGGKETGRTGATEFNALAEQDAVVTVSVAPSAHLLGTVVKQPGEVPAPGATVAIVFFPDMRLATRRVMADAQGDFDFGPMPAGTYPLQASAGGKTSKVVQTVIQEGAVAEPARLVVGLGCAIHGRVTDTAGQAVAGKALLLIEPGAGFGVAQVMTDATGAYRFDNIVEGSYEITMSGDGGPQPGKQVSVRDGEDLEVNFDLAGRVTIAGSLAINGAPAPPGSPILFLSRSGGSTVGATTVSDGLYNAVLVPGTYSMKLDGTERDFSVDIASDVVIPADPANQTRDDKLTLPSLDLVLVPPAGRLLGTGSVDFEERTHQRHDWFQVTTPRLHFPFAPAGEFRAVAKMDNGLQGSSDWTPVQLGSPNSITINLSDGLPHTYELTVTVKPGKKIAYQFYPTPGEPVPDPLNPPTSGTQCTFDVPGGATGPDGTRRPWPRVDDASGKVTFRWTGVAAGGMVYVLGSFNSYQQSEASRMQEVAGE